MNVTRTVPVGGVTYTITTTTQWVDDSTGTTTCPSGATRTDYLKAISIVTWPTMGTIPPVKNQTLIAVPLGTFDDATGGLIAKFIDRAGNGVPSISVVADGPDDEQRHERRRRLRVLERPARGRLLRRRRRSPATSTRTASNTIHQSGTVTGGATNSFIFAYDRASTVDVDLRHVGQRRARRSTRRTDVTVANSGLQSPGTQTFSVGTAGDDDLLGLDALPVQRRVRRLGAARAPAPIRAPTRSRRRRSSVTPAARRPSRSASPR